MHLIWRSCKRQGDSFCIMGRVKQSHKKKKHFHNDLRKKECCYVTLSFLPRVGYILNVTREIDNFFPGTFSYHNIRVYDEDATDLLAHWNDTYNFIVKAK